MTKHIAKDHFYLLPSGNMVHPSRLILKDGTLMWKHALLSNNVLHLPETQAQEQHIIKTAQRLEELNSWISQDLEPWESFQPTSWFDLSHPELNQGISVYFTHAYYDVKDIYLNLLDHIQEHELLEERGRQLFFRRC